MADTAYLKAQYTTQASGGSCDITPIRKNRKLYIFKRLLMSYHYSSDTILFYVIDLCFLEGQRPSLHEVYRFAASRLKMNGAKVAVM